MGQGGVEIERRYLVRVGAGLWDRLGAGHELRQGYLTGAGASVRIRVGQPGGPVLSVKRGEGLTRFEAEDVVSEEMARALMDASEDRIIDKTRWLVGPWELDRFHGDLDGLVLLEVELDHEEEDVPEWPEGIHVLREVTFDNRITSAALANMDTQEKRALVRTVYAEVEG